MRRVQRYAEVLRSKGKNADYLTDSSFKLKRRVQVDERILDKEQLDLDTTASELRTGKGSQVSDE